MATIKDISKALHVSVSTVSMALNDSKEISEKTKLRVRETAVAMNYVRNGSAVNLQRKKTNTILFITDNPTRPYFTDSLRVLQDAVAKEGFDLIIATSSVKNSRSTERLLTERRADAVICWSQFVTMKLIQQCASAEMPIFTMGRADEIEDNPYVFNLNVHQNRAGEEITTYLLHQGMRRIAFVHNENNSAGSDYRKRGYLQALQNFGPEVSPIVFNIESSDYDAGYTVTEKQLTPKILAHQIDAIFYTNDDVAVGGLHCFLKMNISVPDQVSIVGYNNYPSSKLVLPQITTVSLHEREIMQRTADGLIHLLCQSADPESIRAMLSDIALNSEIIERDTVKRVIK